MADLNDGKVVIVAGFQGCDEEGNITTLGRGAPIHQLLPYVQRRMQMNA